MIDGSFALAIAAGMAATVNPCGFALLPAYLAAFIGTEHQPGVGAVPRALAVSAAMTAGFVVVFGLFGLIVTPLALSVEQYLPWVTIVIGIGLVGLGIGLLAGREMALRLPKLDRGGSDGSIGSMFVYGVSYAVASLSCTIGPFLAATSTTFRADGIVSGLVVFVAYALGMGAVVTALTVAVSLARQGLVGRLRAALPYVSRVSGGLLVVAGAYVSWYGWYEVRVLRGGDGSDPIIDRGIVIQAWLQDKVIPDDPVTFLVGIVVVVSVIAGLVSLRSHRRPGREATALDGPVVDGPAVEGTDVEAPSPDSRSVR